MCATADENDAEIEYHVEMYTGLRRHAGTKSKVYINLVGSKCSSGAIHLEDGVRKVKNLRFIYMCINIDYSHC